MTHDSFVALVGNATLLLSLVYVYDLLNVLRWVSGNWIRQAMTGLAIGAVGFFIMLMPWTFVKGVNFDTRSVLLAVSGLFFGTIPTVVAALLTATVRLIQGGGGAWTGVSVIVASGAIGLAWRHARQRQLATLSFSSLYALGLVVHIVMLALMFTQPLQTAVQILRNITVPVLVIYPIATAAYGTLMVGRLRREQSAAALRESERRFRALFEQAAFGVAKADVKTGRLVLVNQHFADLLGYTRDELLTLDLKAVTHPDDRAETFQKMQELASGRISSFVLIKRYVCKDGGVIWCNVTVSRLWGEGDQPDYAMAAIENITDQKNAQEALTVSEERFHELYENMTSGCAIYSVVGDGTTGADYIIRNLNHASLRIEGKAIDEVVGKSLRDLRPHIDDSDLVPVLRDVWRTGQPVFVPIRIDEDGRFSRWYENYIFRLPSGEVVTIYDDATDRRRTEEALVASEERYRTLFESMGIGVFYFRPDGVIMFANPAAEDIFGLTLGEILERRPSDPRWRFIHEDGSDLPAESLLSEVALHIGEATRDIIIGIFNPREEAYRWVRGSAIPQFRAGETSPYQIYVTMEDITKLKRAEAEKEAMQAQLLQSQKMEAVGELAGGVAHDFNNMLTGILGNTAIVQEGLSPDDPLQENVNAIRVAAQEAAELTTGLLTFSRGAIVQPSPLDTNVAVERTLSVLKQSLPASITIVTRLQPNVWNIYMDQTQITQILLNLGVNARDAMEGRGSITISTRNAIVDATYVGMHPFARQGEFVVLGFGDTGPGIAPEVLPRIFEPFFTTKPAGSGTGLGLAIVYGAASQAGGWITVQSDPGQGALFEVYLPRSTRQQLPATTSPSAVTGHCSGTVLVVEDEPIVSSVAQSLLSRAGCDVLVAADGASALQILQSHGKNIDVMLLDMTMPGMSTEEILAETRRMYPSLPVLLTSGFVSTDTVTRLLKAGTVQGFLPKPYEFHELLERVSRLLPAAKGGPV